MRNWLGSGTKVGLLSYEDDTRALASRLQAQRAGVDLRIATGAALGNTHQRRALGEALEWWSTVEGLLETDDARPPGTVDDVVASIREMRRRGCSVAVLDNLTCTRMGGEDRHDLVLEDALSRLRSEAQSLQIPVIVIGHIRRGQTEADESRRPPRPSDFRNGSAWENYSRVLLGMWLTDSGASLRVLKQTEGPPGADFSVEFAREAAVVTGLTRLASSADAAPQSSREQRRYYPRED